MALENGLKPSFRGFKGVGFGRALSAPFAFGNSWVPDGVNDYFVVDDFIGEAYNSVFEGNKTFIFWYKSGAVSTNNERFIDFTGENTMAGNVRFSSMSFVGTVTVTGTGYTTQNYTNLALGSGNNIQMIAISSSDNFMLITSNANVLYSGAKSVNSLDARLLTSFRIGGPTISLKQKMDEFRYYDRRLTYGEILLEYNAGVGSSPLYAENLKVWYDFDAAEIASSLYTGALPPNWVAATWGIRNKADKDSVLKKYHARAANMTNNETLGGTLIPW